MNEATIAKLEALLARVRMRAAEPRRPKTSAAPALAAPPPAAGRAVAEETDDSDELPTRPPPAGVAAPAEPEIVIDVDVPERPSDDVAPAAAASGSDSRERLVAASPATPLPTAEPARDTPDVPVEVAAATTEESTAAHAEPGKAEEDDDEIEPAPSSSRRPVAVEPEERLAEMAFGAVDPQPPRHTPPPESGRLPAAPAADADYDGEITGVRDTSSIAADEAARRASTEGSSPPEVVPEATRPRLPAGDRVAEVMGAARASGPTTFVALLDASLTL